MNHEGTVYWITGLSGAGKTTIGTLLYSELKKNQSIVLLDGDKLRDVYGNDVGYDVDDRKKMAMRNARLCELLSSQGIHVICCTIAMFHSVREWNRLNIKRYKEIYIKVSFDVLHRRNQKNLYSKELNGDINNIVGIDIEMEEPISPDILINNDGFNTPSEIVSIIVNNLKNGSY